MFGVVLRLLGVLETSYTKFVSRCRNFSVLYACSKLLQKADEN